MTIGFIGFGEAGFTIGGGLRAAGAEVLAYDIATDPDGRRRARSTPGNPTLIRSRAAQSGVRLVDSPAALAASVTVLLSTVTCRSALHAAEQHAPFLMADHLYADLNSVSPGVKRQIAAVVESAGATFVEIAVMAPVGPYGHRVPMLLGGEGAAAFLDRLGPLGMQLQVLAGAGVGTAAATKMCRSVVIKGLEALLTECVLGASEYGATEHVFASLQESYPGIDWKALADYDINRVVVHGERRAREMEEVAETLQEAGVEPIMAAATARRQDWSAKIGLKQHFPSEGPKTAVEVLDVLRRISRH